MVMSGEYLPDAIFVQQFQITLAGFKRDIEILVRFVGILQKQRNVLKQDRVPHAILLRLGQLRSEPRLHFGGFLGHVPRRLLQVGIQYEAGDIAHAKTVIVRPETLAIRGQRCGGRLVLHVVITRHAEQLDGWIQLVRNPLVFRRLSRVARSDRRPRWQRPHWSSSPR